MDWIGAAINVTGWYIMPKNRLLATCIFLIGNMVWISWGIGHTTWSIIVLQGFFVFLNIRAILIWRKSVNQVPGKLINFLNTTCQLLSITDISPPESLRESVVTLLIIIIEIFRRLILSLGVIPLLFRKIVSAYGKKVCQSEPEASFKLAFLRDSSAFPM